MSQNFQVKENIEMAYDRKNLVIACDVVNGKVTHVDVSSEMMGAIFAGDEIISVSGEKNIKTTADFNKAIIGKLPGKFVIELLRDDNCLVEEKTLTPRRPNSIMVELSLTYRGGAATGLIIHRMPTDPKTVTIAMVPSSSNASRHVKNGDILVKVNDVYAQDRDAARKLIYASVNNTKKVKLTLERSTTEQPLGPGPPPPPGAKSTTVSKSITTTKKDPLSGASVIAPPPPPTPVVPSVMAAPSSQMKRPIGVANKQFDVILPADVLEIMQKNKEFYKKPCTLPACILKPKDLTASVMGQVFSLKTDQPEVKIPYDPSPKPLRTTPKRVGS